MSAISMDIILDTRLKVCGAAFLAVRQGQEGCHAYNSASPNSSAFLTAE
jgi:hypothetical protein